MGLTLRQGSIGQRADRLQAAEPERLIKQIRGKVPVGLKRPSTEMVGKPRPPLRLYPRARFGNAALAVRLRATEQTGMTPCSSHRMFTTALPSP